MTMARSENPALILMDMSLPVLDGWEATRRLKAAPETKASRSSRSPRTPWPAMSRKRATRGCDDFDTKPIDFRAAARKNRSADHCGPAAMSKGSRNVAGAKPERASEKSGFACAAQARLSASVTI
jgi:DNA-binding NarL/FixJ family response regulator